MLLSRRLLPVSIFLFIALCSCGRGPVETPVQKLASAGEAAPDFAIPDLYGKTVRLSDFKGRIVVLEFWATWCAPCKYAIPDLNAIADRYRNSGVAVIGVSVDTGRNLPGRLGSFSSEHHINYQVLLGSEDVSRNYGVRSIPATFLINREGTLVESFQGYSVIMKEKLESRIKEII